MKTIRGIVTILLMSIMFLGLVSCSRRGGETSVIRINIGHAITSVVTQMLKMSDSFKNILPDGVSVEWTTVNRSNDIRDAIAAGRIDVGAIGIAQLLSALANDLPIVLISYAGPASGFIYSANPSIRSAEDMHRANRIAISNIGGVQHFRLMLLAKEFFGDANIFNNRLVSMQTPDMLATVETSDILDLIVVSSTISALTENVERLNRIADLSMLGEDGMFLVAGREFYENNPALIDILRGAFREVVDFLNENPDKAAQLLADEFGYSDAAEIAEELKLSPPRIEVSESGFDMVVEAMYAFGMIPRRVLLADLPNYNSIPKRP